MKHRHSMLLTRLKKSYFFSLIFLMIMSIGTVSKAFASVLPYEDMIFIAFDNSIDPAGNDELHILTFKDINKGFSFGLTNVNSLTHDSALDNGNYKTVELVYTGSLPIPAGSVLKITTNDQQNGMSALTIFYNSSDISSRFDQKIIHAGQGGEGFLTNGQSQLYMYQGSWYVKEEKPHLFGVIVDGIVLGYDSNHFMQSYAPVELRNKDLIFTPHQGPFYGDIDLRECDLCLLLEIILDIDNWDLSGGGGESPDLGGPTIDLSDCFEEECPGALFLTVDGCDILIKESPCPGDNLEYTWTFNGIQIESGYSTDPSITDAFTGTYALDITCENGCQYSYEIDVVCNRNECNSEVSIDTTNCVLFATVNLCPDAEYQWYKQTATGEVKLNGETNPTLNPLTPINYGNGVYYVKVNNCTSCPELTSNEININCLPECDCEAGLQLQPNTNECTQLVSDGCVGYDISWHYSPLSDPLNWTTISGANTNTLPLENEENGWFKRTFSKDGCSEVSDSILVDCIFECPEVTLTLFENDCMLQAEWSGCNPYTSVNWFFVPSANENCNSANGNATIANGIISPIAGGQGVIFSPTNGAGCYIIELTCDPNCAPITDTIYWTPCCSEGGNVSIQIEDCVASVIEYPDCSTSAYTYQWSIDNNPLPQGTTSGQNIPDLSLENTPGNSVTMRIICPDQCTYTDGESFNCYCESQVNGFINGCILSVEVSHCPGATYIWEEDLGNGYSIINGATSNSYEATGNGNYRVKIEGCDPYCGELDYEWTNVLCGINCDCEITLSTDANNCEVFADKEDCEGYYLYSWQYSESNAPHNWEDINYPEPGSEPNGFFPPENGFYRLLYKKPNCPDKFSNIVEVTCNEDCEEFEVINTDTNCDEILIEYSGLGIPNYAYFELVNDGSSGICDENLNNQNGNIDPNSYDDNTFSIDPTGSNFLVTFNPSLGTGCYRLTMQWLGCQEEYVYALWDNCCEDDPWIDVEEDNCQYNMSVFINQADPNSNNTIEFINEDNSVYQTLRAHKLITSTCGGVVVDESVDFDVKLGKELAISLTGDPTSLVILNGGYMDWIKLWDNNSGNYEIIDLNPTSTPHLNGIDPNDLYRGNLSDEAWAETIEDLIENAISDTYNSNSYELNCSVGVDGNGTYKLSIVFTAKHNPSGQWIGLNPISNASGSYFSMYTSTIFASAGCGGTAGCNKLVFLENPLITLFYDSPCGSLDINRKVSVNQSGSFYGWVSFNTGHLNTISSFNNSLHTVFISGTANSVTCEVDILTVENVCTGATYEWSTGATTSWIEVPTTGSYSVTVTCPDGCSYVLDYPSGSTRQSNEPGISIFSQEKEKTPTRDATKTGTHNLKIYPNPTLDHFTLEASSRWNETATMRLLSSTGETVMSQLIEMRKGINNHRIDISTITPGLYFVHLAGEQHDYGFRKVIVIR